MEPSQIVANLKKNKNNFLIKIVSTTAFQNGSKITKLCVEGGGGGYFKDWWRLGQNV
jgi:hypothetical protein